VDVKSKHLPPDRVLEASPSSSSSSCMLVVVVQENMLLPLPLLLKARTRTMMMLPARGGCFCSWILLAGGVGIDGRSSLPQRPHPTQDDLTDGDGVQSGRDDLPTDPPTRCFCCWSNGEELKWSR
jgi:hypothetical protein